GEVVGIHVCGRHKRSGKATGLQCATPVARFRPYLEKVVGRTVVWDRLDERTEAAEKGCLKGDSDACKEHFWTLAFDEIESRMAKLATLCHTHRVTNACFSRAMLHFNTMGTPFNTLSKARPGSLELDKLNPGYNDLKRACTTHDHAWSCLLASRLALGLDRKRERAELLQHACNMTQNTDKRTDACYLLGLVLRRGSGIEADEDRAVTMLTELCYTHDHHRSCSSLAWWHYQHWIPGPKDAFLNAWSHACDLGQLSACTWVGGFRTIALDPSFHVPELGEPLLIKNCAEGRSNACHWLGNFYLFAERYAEARDPLHRACHDIEDDDACLSLALALKSGLVVGSPQEQSRTIYLAKRDFQKDCEAGNRAAANDCLSWAILIEEGLLAPDHPEQQAQLRARACASEPRLCSEARAVELLNTFHGLHRIVEQDDSK
ncbi:MAG: hypothetical protein AAFX99_33855, partial [Myxococcota bacterium]